MSTPIWHIQLIGLIACHVFGSVTSNRAFLGKDIDRNSLSAHALQLGNGMPMQTQSLLLFRKKPQCLTTWKFDDEGKWVDNCRIQALFNS